MTGTELAVAGALAVRAGQSDWTDTQKAALAQMGIAEAPRGDQLVFLHVSQQMGLDPFAGEIYMIGRWDAALGRKKWTIQVGINGFRAKSEEHPEFAGVGDAEWCGEDGVWHDVWLSDEPPKAARFTVYRKDQGRPTRSVALYREYVQTKSDGKIPTQRWANAPADQLAKCAEAKARRTAFPRRLGGVYAPEEMEHLSNPQPIVVESQRVEAEQIEQAEPDWDGMITASETAVSRDDLTKVWNLARGLRPNDGALLNKIAEAGERINQAAVAAAQQQAMNRLFALLSDGGVPGSDKPRRIRLANRILSIEGRPPEQPITSFTELSTENVDAISAFLTHHKNAGDLTHTLAELGADQSAPPAE